jgi:hypothetical protein
LFTGEYPRALYSACLNNYNTNKAFFQYLYHKTIKKEPVPAARVLWGLRYFVSGMKVFGVL